MRNSCLSCKIILLFLFAFQGWTGSAQVSTYAFSEQLAAYTAISGSTEAYPAGWDDHTPGAAALISFGFDFVYDGVTYTECYVSPNGYITFGPTQPLTGTYTPINTNTTQQGIISALGTNLRDGDSLPIRYVVQGASPNRILIVQWANAERVLEPGFFNFQIKLFETSNQIQVAYGNCVPTSTAVRAVQVGLRGPNTIFPSAGNVGNVLNRLKVTSTPWFGTTVRGTANNSNVRTLGNTLPFPAPPSLAYPDLGLTYTWSPPTANCVTPPSSPTSLVIGGTNTTFNSFVGNFFTGVTPAPTNYLVLRSLVNTPPTAAEVIDGRYWVAGNTISGTYVVVSSATSATTTFNQTGLTAGTTYYYWVIPYNDTCIGAPFYRLTNILTASATTCTPTAVATAATAVNGNGFTLNWNSQPIATDYRIDISTNSTFTNILPAFNNLSVGLVTSFTVTNLPTAINYWYRVRAVGPGCANNSNVINVGLLPCGFYEIPYTQNFDATTVPIAGLTPCFTRENTNTDVIQWSVQTVNFASSPKAMFIAKNPTVDMDDWFFMPGLNLTGGTSYRLFFRYNTGAAGTFFENLRVRLGNAQSVAGMNTTLLGLLNINNTSFQVASVDFVPVSTGIYYIGFEGFSIADQSFIAIDDISVTISPTCFEPTEVQVSSVTNNSADISWTAAVPPPSNGYQYYYSTSPTPPTAATAPSGSVGAGITSTTISGLTASAFYYLWVRGFCGSVDRSIWSEVQTFTTECNIPLITSSAGASRCGVGTLNLTATPNTGSFIEWYDVPTDGLSIFTGNNFTTPSLGSSSVYYVQAKAFGATAKVGPTSPTTLGGIIETATSPTSMSFDVFNSTTIQAVDIFPLASGQAGQLVLRNSFNITIAIFPFTTSVTGGSTPQTIALNYPLPPGTYNLFLGTMPTSGLRVNTSGALYPYISTVAEITGNPIDNTSYFFFYNWKFTTECISPRIAVNATVSNPPAFSLSSTAEVICNGQTTSLVSVFGASSYSNFAWSTTVGVSGSIAAGFQFNPTTTTIYTLTASQSSGAFCTNVATITVTVNPLPPAIAIVPVTAIICENAIQSLAASVGSTTSTVVYNENFNGTAPGWVAANTSTAGDVAASQWTLRSSPYVYVSPNWNTAFGSNDSSQFFLTNSDSQGETTITRTTLTSPPIDLSVYVSASVSFWHWLRYVSGDVAQISVSTDGTNWIVVENFVGSQRAGLNMIQHTINLDAYTGNPNVQIRFYFQSNWGWAWSMDNFEVSAEISLEVLWSPDTELFTDVAATVPYVLGTPVGIVYAQPTSTRSYTATALGTNGCSTSEDILITVDPLSVGGTLSGSQIVCLGTVPAVISLSGYTGTIIRWESADDAAFTLNVATISNTADTLTPAQMGITTTTKYFRAVIRSGVCALVYSTVESVEFPTTIWNGTTWSNGLPDALKKVVFAGNYTSSGDIEACTIEIQSGTVNVLANHNFIVNNEVEVTGPPATTSLIFQNNASLIQLTNAVNAGSITYIRNATPMVRNDYTYWSSPVANQVLNVFSPLTNPNRYYRFDNGIYNWLAVPGASVMIPAVGYIIRAPSNYDTVTPSTYIGQFRGVPNNGNYTFPIVVNTAPNPIQDRNLIGNPYPSAIDADLLLAANLPTLQGSFYFWTHNTPITNFVYTANDYAVYNQSGGTSAAANIGVNNNPPTQFIAAGQSFFVQGIASGTLTFSNSVRVSGNNTSFFRNSQQNTIETREKHRIWLNLINTQGAFKQILVGYIQDATNQLDNYYDSEIAEAGNTVSLYTMVADKKLAIQGRSLPFQENDTVPLGFRITNAGNYAIQLADFDGLFASALPIYIEDKLLNITHNIRETNYEFITDVGEVEGRFVLKFQNETLGLPTTSIENSVVFKNQNNIEIVASANVTLDEVKVFDMRGRLITSLSKINAATATLTNLNVANQVVLVQVTDLDGNVVTKKLIY